MEKTQEFYSTLPKVPRIKELARTGINRELPEEGEVCNEI
jgi:hypothetical protein